MSSTAGDANPGDAISLLEKLQIRCSHPVDYDILLSLVKKLYGEDAGVKEVSPTTFHLHLPPPKQTSLRLGRLARTFEVDGVPCWVEPRLLSPYTITAFFPACDAVSLGLLYDSMKFRGGALQHIAYTQGKPVVTIHFMSAVHQKWYFDGNQSDKFTLHLNDFSIPMKVLGKTEACLVLVHLTGSDANTWLMDVLKSSSPGKLLDNVDNNKGDLRKFVSFPDRKSGEQFCAQFRDAVIWAHPYDTDKSRFHQLDDRRFQGKTVLAKLYPGYIARLLAHLFKDVVKQESDSDSYTVDGDVAPDVKALASECPALRIESTSRFHTHVEILCTLRFVAWYLRHLLEKKEGQKFFKISCNLHRNCFIKCSDRGVANRVKRWLKHGLPAGIVKFTAIKVRDFKENAKARGRGRGRGNGSAGGRRRSGGPVGSGGSTPAKMCLSSFLDDKQPQCRQNRQRQNRTAPVRKEAAAQPPLLL